MLKNKSERPQAICSNLRSNDLNLSIFGFGIGDEPMPSQPSGLDDSGIEVTDQDHVKAVKFRVQGFHDGCGFLACYRSSKRLRMTRRVSTVTPEAGRKIDYLKNVDPIRAKMLTRRETHEALSDVSQVWAERNGNEYWQLGDLDGTASGDAPAGPLAAPPRLIFDVVVRSAHPSGRPVSRIRTGGDEESTNHLYDILTGPDFTDLTFDFPNGSFSEHAPSQVDSPASSLRQLAHIMSERTDGLTSPTT